MDAVPFFFAGELSRKWLGIGNGIASGPMLGASFGLIAEGMAYSWLRVVTGILVGVLFITVSHRYLENHDELEVGQLEGANALKALMIVGAMVWMVFAELVPDALAETESNQVAMAVTLAFAAMVALQQIL